MSGLPSNFATGIAYSGMNIMLLWCSASEQGFGDSRWMTYKQAQAVAPHHLNWGGTNLYLLTVHSHKLPRSTRRTTIRSYMSPSGCQWAMLFVEQLDYFVHHQPTA
ncbi:hypothetical protein PEC301877_13310 [Pectobacterium carotovorum subsp. carotovorum]|nr:hypothetical protein PEC301877_13310 [Pectobacterium carotovorum subsp. carotovorum]